MSEVMKYRVRMLSLCGAILASGLLTTDVAIGADDDYVLRATSDTGRVSARERVKDNCILCSSPLGTNSPFGGGSNKPIDLVTKGSNGGCVVIIGSVITDSISGSNANVNTSTGDINVEC